MPRHTEVLVDCNVSRKCFSFIVPIITFELFSHVPVRHKMVAEQPKTCKAYIFTMGTRNYCLVHNVIAELVS